MVAGVGGPKPAKTTKNYQNQPKIKGKFSLNRVFCILFCYQRHWFFSLNYEKTKLKTSIFLIIIYYKEVNRIDDAVDPYSGCYGTDNLHRIWVSEESGLIVRYTEDNNNWTVFNSEPKDMWSQTRKLPSNTLRRWW